MQSLRVGVLVWLGTGLFLCIILVVNVAFVFACLWVHIYVKYKMQLFHICREKGA